MSFDRRSFLRSSSLAALGGALLPWPQASAASAANRKLILVPTAPPTPPEQKVLGFVGGYSSERWFAGGSALAKLRGGAARSVRILARIAGTEKLQSAMTRFSFIDGYSQGNSLSFTQDGFDFLVENIVSAEFDAAFAACSGKTKISFAHQALLLDPTTGQASDPFGARNSAAIKIVNKGSGLAGCFETLLRGRIAAAELSLERDTAFKSFSSAVLNATAARDRVAQAIVDALIRQITALADALPTANIETILQTPLVSSALERILGIKAKTLIANFGAFRMRFGADYSDAAVWLAALLEKELGGAVITEPSALGAETDLSRLRKTRAALGQARMLVATATTI